MKDTILKLAGVKSEKALYAKYGTETAFMKVHGKQLKKAILGEQIKKAKIGNYIQTENNIDFNPLNTRGVFDTYDKLITGTTQKERENKVYREAMINSQNSKGSGGGGMDLSSLMNLASMFGKGSSTSGGNSGVSAQAEPSSPGAAKKGKKILKAQEGIHACGDGQVWDPVSASCIENNGYNSSQDAQKNTSSIPVINNFGQTVGGPASTGVDTGGTSPNPYAPQKKRFDMLDKIPVVGGVIKGLYALNEEKKQKWLAKQQDVASGVFEQAANSATQGQPARRYDRPEDYLTQNTNPYGSAAKGKKIPGNSTEIQNTFAPHDIYNNMGYEPLSDSEIIKQYREGGLITIAQGGWQGMAGNMATGALTKYAGNIGGYMGGDSSGQPNAGSQIGGAIGGAFKNPVIAAGASIIGGALDQNIGKTKAYQKDTYNHMWNTVGAGVAQGLRSQNRGYMKKGGVVMAQNGENFEQRYKRLLSGFTDEKGNSLKNEKDENIINGFGVKGLDKTSNTYDGGFDETGKIISNMTPFKWLMLQSDYFKRNSPYSNVYHENIQHHSFEPKKDITTGKNGWMNPEYNPQVITKFGELTAQDYYKFAHKGIDTLRTGGQLRQNQLPMGGELQTHWGGVAEPVSQNPHLPNGGQTVMFKGNSHKESDGYGHTGIGVSYGDNNQDSYTDYAEYGTGNAQVEVQSQEPAIQTNDSTGNPSLTVFGGRKTNKEVSDYAGVDKGRSYQSIGKELAEKTNNNNKRLEKTLIQLKEHEDETPIGQLTLNALRATVTGLDMKNKKIADTTTNLAEYQNKTAEFADMFNLDVNKLDKGIFTKDKSKNAKYGKNLKKAQTGHTWDINDDSTSNTDKIGNLFVNRYSPQHSSDFYNSSSTLSDLNTKISIPTTTDTTTKKSTLTKDLMDVYNQMLPYLRKTNQKALDTNQLVPEMLAGVINQEEPVTGMQSYQPILENNPSSISLQDQLNEVDKQSRAVQRTIKDPTILAGIFANAYDAKNKILSEQFRINQSLPEEVRRRNISMLNDARVRNLQMYKEQAGEQAMAHSKTKAEAIEIAKSIADKQAKHDLENRTLGIYENLYNYRFDNEGRAINENPLQKFNLPIVGENSSPSTKKLQPPTGFEFLYDANGNPASMRKATKKTTPIDDGDAKYGIKIKARNGAIVKALKNI